MNLGMETDDPLPPGNLRSTRMILSESGNGRGANRTRSITEKIAVFAPMPSARARTATLVKPGLLIRTRKEWRRSASRVSIITYTETRASWFPRKSLGSVPMVFEAALFNQPASGDWQNYFAYWRTTFTGGSLSGWQRKRALVASNMAELSLS